jgi:hypothetical protein
MQDKTCRTVSASSKHRELAKMWLKMVSAWLCVPNSLRERFDLEALEARPVTVYGRPAYVLDTSLGPSSGANLCNKALYSSHHATDATPTRLKGEKNGVRWKATTDFAVTAPSTSITFITYGFGLSQ